MSLLSEVLQEAEQGSDLWDKVRLGKFTSSEITRLICKTKDKDGNLKLTEKARKYICEKVGEVLTGEPAKIEFETDAMRWGKQKEAEARTLFEQRMEMEVFVPGFRLRDEWYGGSPDGEIGEDGLIEIKCPNTATHIAHLAVDSADNLKEEFPEHYYQIQSNLNITDRQWGFFISYDPRLKDAPFFQILVKRDPKAIQEINESVKAGTAEAKRILAKLRGE